MKKTFLFEITTADQLLEGEALPLFILQPAKIILFSLRGHPERVVEEDIAAVDDMGNLV
jgi:hypothetical protein